MKALALTLLLVGCATPEQRAQTVTDTLNRTKAFCAVYAVALELPRDTTMDEVCAVLLRTAVEPVDAGEM